MGIRRSEWHNTPMTHRILLADDHALVRAGIRNALAGLPDLEIVGEVGDGSSLESLLAECQPDCLLIDVTMPSFEPVAAIRRIRSRYPQLRILVVSAYDDDVYVQGLLGAGVNGYHLKDQPMSDLRLAVMRVLAGERWISSSLVDKLLHSQRVTAVTTLSTRQQDILRLLAEGLDNRAIAQRLNLSVKTVENHLTRLYRQLDVQSRLEAATHVREHPELLARVSPEPEARHGNPPLAEQAAILVVDDNGRYRTQLRRTIAKIFPDTMIYEAGNTAEAIHLASRVTPQIAFVDVVLGDEDGIRCTRRLRVESPVTRIVLISAYPDREFHRLGLEAGATAFVDKKDLDAATLQQIIADVIG
ncbi:MAG: LuxR family transcriptional regulator [Chloroflexota bacterium]|nr:MAG: LuxR family transcriptional regulator [Chloroflexota bacterium]